MATGGAPGSGGTPGPGRHGARRGPGHRRHPAGGSLSGLVVVFLDGVGIGPADPDVNPFVRARLPVMRRLLGGETPTLDAPAPPDGRASRGDPPTLGDADGTASAVGIPLDATLGVDGLPQSGTGQATLLTGDDAVARHGAHFGPWVPVRLRPLVERRNLLVRAAAAGLGVAFANAYPRGWPGSGRGARRVAGPPLAARAAGLLTRDRSDLARRRAVASEIVNDGWRRWTGDESIPTVSATEAGTVLASIALRHDLTFFAHYATDTAGHRGGMAGAIAALERVDAFLGGLVDTLSSDRTVFVVSDHGNIEDVRGGHTRNPALGLLTGPGARERARSLGSLLDVTPAVLDWLGVSEGAHHPRRASRASPAG